MENERARDSLTRLKGVESVIRTAKAEPETKVVIITAYEDDAMVLRAIEAGCSGFVSKSQNVNMLVAVLRAAEAGEALIPPAMLRRLLPRLSPTQRGVGRDLTPREHEVLALLAEGLPNREIAVRLGIELTTARNHVQNILSKLDMKCLGLFPENRHASLDIRRLQFRC